MALSATQRDFVASAYAAARAAGLSGVQADLAVSQAIHESAWGTRPSGTNNVHGIKGKGTSVQTHEIENGKRVNQRASFRNFGSMTESFRAWKGLMERKFSAVMNATTLPEAVKALKAGKQGGYATDPKYDDKVKAIAGTVTRMPLAPPSLVAGLGNVPLPSSPGLMGRFAQAPIPPGLPSVARPDNMMASGPRFDNTIRSMMAEVARQPAPERFGGSGRGSGTAPPVMAGFTPDPARFDRTPMAPAAAATGDRVGSGSFSAPPDPARFGPPPSAPSPAMRMAPPNVPDPARLGQIALGPQAAPVNRSVEPANPGQLGGVRMSNPVGLGGPGGLMVAPTPPVAPAPPPVQPAAPPLPQPTMATDMPVHQVEAGAPPMVPQAPRSPSGNTVEMDQFGNRSVTNKYGATTITGPGGNQSFGSLNMGQGSIPSIPGPLGNPLAFGSPEQPQGFGKTLGGGLLGARMGAGFGPVGMAAGGLLGALLGRELSKPGGGVIGQRLGIGQRNSLPAFVPDPQMFPKAPPGGAQSYRYPELQSNRSFAEMESMFGSRAANAVRNGGGGLY